MQYCILIRAGEVSNLERLEQFHDKEKKSEDDFFTVLTSFIEENRESLFIINKVYIENLISNVRQIIFSFSEFKKAKDHLPSDKNSEGNYYFDVETSALLVFFFNAKSFLEIIKNFTKYPQNTQFKQLMKDITLVRNHLAHSYNKDTYLDLYPQAIVVNIIQRGLDIEVMEITDLKIGVPLGRLYFSFYPFYFSLKNIFETLKDNLELFEEP